MRAMQVLCNVFLTFSVIFAGASLFIYPPIDKESTVTVISEIRPAVNVVEIIPEPVVVEPVRVSQKPQKVPHSKDLECMALNIYHEARGESTKGKEAVAWVTLNRVKHSRYPSSVCGVVKQAKYSKWFQEVKGKNVPLKNQCHFSWYCDGRDDTPKDKVQWEESKRIANKVMTQYNRAADPTKGAIMYHANYVKPYWRKHYQILVKIDTHIFYGERGV